MKPRGRKSRAVAWLCVISALTACGCAQREVASEAEPWTIAPSPGAEVHEYGVPEGDAQITLEVDMVLGSQAPPGVLFDLPTDIAVDDEGRIYVLDAGDSEVLVFAPDGEPVMVVGGAGEGPGELGRSTQLAVTGDRLYVQDMQNRRITIWDREGTYVGQTPLRPGERYEQMYGAQDGRIIAVQTRRAYDGTEIKRFVLLNRDAREVEEVFALAPRHDVQLRSNIDEPYLEGLLASVNDRTQPTPMVAVTREGALYLTDAVAYQVHALEPSGHELWALRSLFRAADFPEEEIDRVVSIARKKVAVRSSWIDWPEKLPAISRLATDGRDRLYVFPYRYFDPENPPEEVPVQVFDDSGNYLLGGSIPFVEWTASFGDYVYGRRMSPESDEWEVVRWRVQVPGAG